MKNKINKNIFSKKLFIRLLLIVYLVASLIFILYILEKNYRGYLLAIGRKQGETFFLESVLDQLETSPCNQITVTRGENSFTLINTACLKE